MATLIAETAFVDPRAEIAEGGRDRPLLRGRSRTSRSARNTRLDRARLPARDRRDGRVQRRQPVQPSSAASRKTSPTTAPRPGSRSASHNVIREGVTINRATEKEDGDHPTRQPQLPDGHLARRPPTASSATRSRSPTARCSAATSTSSRMPASAAASRSTTTRPSAGYSFVGGQSRIIHDVPRYMLVDGNPLQGALHLMWSA